MKIRPTDISFTGASSGYALTYNGTTVSWTNIGAVYAPLASPALTGTPTAPTASAGTNTTQLATTAFTTAAVLVETNRATTAEALLAPKSSPIFTIGAALGTSTGAADINFDITTAVGHNRRLRFLTGTGPRWAFAVSASAESGGNVGSDFNIQRYDDTGTFINNVMSFTRSTGVVTFPVPPMSATPLPGDNSTQVATTAFVQALTNPSWAAYTPTITAGSGTPSSVSASAATRTEGNITFVDISVTVGSSGVGTATGVMNVSIPTAAVGNFVMIARETAVAGLMCTATAFNGTTTLQVVKYDNSTVWNNSWTIVISGFYRNA